MSSRQGADLAALLYWSKAELARSASGESQPAEVGDLLPWSSCVKGEARDCAGVQEWLWVLKVV